MKTKTNSLQNQIKRFAFYLCAFLVISLSSCEKDSSENQLGSHPQRVVNSERVGYSKVVNEIQNPILKDFLKNDLPSRFSMDISANRTDEELLEFEKIVNEGKYTTFLLLTNEYSPSKPYMEYFVIKKDEETEKAGFIKYVPAVGSEVDDPQKIDPKTFSGVIQMYNIDDVLVGESEYAEGLRIMAFSTTSCRDIISVNVFSCSNGGNHAPGTSCGDGFTNDGYYEIRIITVCSQNYNFVYAPDVSMGPSSGGGGGAMTPEQSAYYHFVHNQLSAEQTSILAVNPQLKEYLQANILDETKKWYVYDILDVATEDTYETAEEKSLLIKMTLAAYENVYFEAPFDANYYNAIDPLVEVDLSGDPSIQVWQIHFSARVAILKLQHPDWSIMKVYWEASKEMVHLGLDIVGLVPVVGEVADITNGVIYTIEGDGLNATLSYAGAIPIAGWAATGAKMAIKTVDAGTTTLKWMVRADGIITFGNRGQLRKIIGLSVGDPRQAHHIVAWATDIAEHPLVQKAANAGFHLNEVTNGIAVAAWRNQPNHTDYNTKILSKIEAISQQNPNFTPAQAQAALSALANQIRAVIANNPTVHLNDLVF